MKICNNTTGIRDCNDKYYKYGLCIKNRKCKDSLFVNENVIKQLIIEKCEYNKIFADCIDNLIYEAKTI
jgi:hypothetical protein